MLLQFRPLVSLPFATAPIVRMTLLNSNLGFARQDSLVPLPDPGAPPPDPVSPPPNPADSLPSPLAPPPNPVAPPPDPVAPPLNQPLPAAPDVKSCLGPGRKATCI